MTASFQGQAAVNSSFRVPFNKWVHVAYQFDQAAQQQVSPHSTAHTRTHARTLVLAHRIIAMIANSMR